MQRWTPCGVAWGHSGNTPGYLVYTWISPDTRHETVLMINADPTTVGKPATDAFVNLLDPLVLREVIVMRRILALWRPLGLLLAACSGPSGSKTHHHR